MRPCTIRKVRCITVMQEALIPQNCRISTVFAEDFPARAFQSRESAEALKMQEEHFSLKLLGSLPLKDLCFFFLKMFPDCYRMTAAGRLRPSSARFLNWGTMSHGRCLTARISEFPNPERECILSDILESDVPEKYWLSHRQMQSLLFKPSPAEKANESTLPREQPSR